MLLNVENSYKFSVTAPTMYLDENKTKIKSLSKILMT